MSALRKSLAPGEHRSSSVLSHEANLRIFALLGSKAQAVSTGVVTVMGADPPEHTTWHPLHTGVVTLTKDYARKAYFLQVYDLVEWQRVQEVEVTKGARYLCSSPLFHQLPAQGRMLGLKFASEVDAREFAAAAALVVAGAAPRKPEGRPPPSPKEKTALTQEKKQLAETNHLDTNGAAGVAPLRDQLPHKQRQGTKTRKERQPEQLHKQAKPPPPQPPPHPPPQSPPHPPPPSPPRPPPQSPPQPPPSPPQSPRPQQTPQLCFPPQPGDKMTTLDRKRTWKKLTKDMISSPTNFQHLYHVGFDPGAYPRYSTTNEEREQQQQEEDEHQWEQHQQEPHQQEPHQQAPHQQEPHQQEPHQQAPHQQEPHQQEPHQQAPHQQAPHQQEPHQQEPHQQAPTAPNTGLHMRGVDPSKRPAPPPPPSPVEAHSAPTITAPIFPDSADSTLPAVVPNVSSSHLSLGFTTITTSSTTTTPKATTSISTDNSNEALLTPASFFTVNSTLETSSGLTPSMTTTTSYPSGEPPTSEFPPHTATIATNSLSSASTLITTTNSFAEALSTTILPNSFTEGSSLDSNCDAEQNTSLSATPSGTVASAQDTNSSADLTDDFAAMSFTQLAFGQHSAESSLREETDDRSEKGSYVESEETTGSSNLGESTSSNDLQEMIVLSAVEDPRGLTTSVGESGASTTDGGSESGLTTCTTTTSPYYPSSNNTMEVTDPCHSSSTITTTSTDSGTITSVTTTTSASADPGPSLPTTTSKDTDPKSFASNNTEPGPSVSSITHQTLSTVTSTSQEPSSLPVIVSFTLKLSSAGSRAASKTSDDTTPFLRSSTSLDSNLPAASSTTSTVSSEGASTTTIGNARPAAVSSVARRMSLQSLPPRKPKRRPLSCIPLGAPPPPPPSTPPPSPSTTPPPPSTPPPSPSTTPPSPSTTPPSPSTTPPEPSTTPPEPSTTPPEPSTPPPSPSTPPPSPSTTPLQPSTQPRTSSTSPPPPT
ncbi:uncharacterized protein [Procambarus clarkii]|uniref:uncharacterized protein n=1 Tax=Procambarus clarkii TaxID=6728 RepID=UPI003742A2A5